MGLFFRFYAHTKFDNNEFDNNAMAPKGFASLIASGGGVTALDPLAWDGLVDPDKDNADGSLTTCFSNNTNADGTPATYRMFNTEEGWSNHSTDLGENDCEQTPLPATVIE